MRALDETKAAGWFALWTLGWVATLALAKFGPQHLWEPAAASWIAVAANLIAGIGWIVAFTRLLRALDELQRKIVQEALAITLGVGWVIGFAYVVADTAGLITRDVNGAALPVLMGIVFMVAFAAGRFQYR
ncbi:hypothetical protein [Actinoplanes sp. DH11]|uniref:hypothetical protein n=1 Tax=Actinoplanes sp. DH11 TaxID=2857011 RepID=UPI001E647D76|nr:hypothetical protein [Actinoplanes sp. DH11]